MTILYQLLLFSLRYWGSTCQTAVSDKKLPRICNTFKYVFQYLSEFLTSIYLWNNSQVFTINQVNVHVCNIVRSKSKHMKNVAAETLFGTIWRTSNKMHLIWFTTFFVVNFAFFYTVPHGKVVILDRSALSDESIFTFWPSNMSFLWPRDWNFDINSYISKNNYMEN